MTTNDSQEAIARAAVSLDQARGLLVRVRDEGEREWPEAMANGEEAPSLDYRVHIDARLLLEDFVEPGLALALDTSRLTSSRISREWQAERGAAARSAAELSALFAAPANDEDHPVPYFLQEVAAVMYAAHDLREKWPLTGEERATLSRAIRLQAALLGEEALLGEGDLVSYIRRALSEEFLPATLDEAKDLRIPVRQALESLSKSALGFSAMLKRASDLDLDTGIDQKQIASITEAIEELARQVAALETREDA